jgi:hypothetical protein
MGGQWYESQVPGSPQNIFTTIHLWSDGHIRCVQLAESRNQKSPITSGEFFSTQRYQRRMKDEGAWRTQDQAQKTSARECLNNVQE